MPQCPRKSPPCWPLSVQCPQMAVRRGVPCQLHKRHDARGVDPQPCPPCPRFRGRSIHMAAPGWVLGGARSGEGNGNPGRGRRLCLQACPVGPVPQVPAKNVFLAGTLKSTHWSILSLLFVISLPGLPSLATSISRVI